MVMVMNVRQVMVEVNRMLTDGWTSHNFVRTCWAYRTGWWLDGRQWSIRFFRLRICRRRRRVRMVNKVMMVMVLLLAATADARLGRVGASGQLQQSSRGLLDVAIEAHRPMDDTLTGRHRFAFHGAQRCDAY